MDARTPQPGEVTDRNLALELVRVTEAAALAASGWIGLGKKNEADGAAVEAMRKAFMETMGDKDFIADANKAIMEIRPVSGADIQKLVEEVYETPAAVVRKTMQLLQ